MNFLSISDKNIINEQFLLNRLASAAIDIYVTTCMLSRCTQSLNEGLPSAMHEELLTKVHNAYTDTVETLRISILNISKSTSLSMASKIATRRPK